MPEPKKTSELVIFFADVAGSTRMYEIMGDSVAHEGIVKSLESISKYVKRNQGVVVEVIGDEIMAYFEQTMDAFNCACEIQKHFDFSPAFHNHKIKIRIGFYQGSVELDQGHPYGDTVNVAARVTALARGGQTITTLETIDPLSEDKKALCRPFSRVKVKGKTDPLDTVEVIWSLEDATSIFVPSQVIDTSDPTTEVVLTYNGQETVIEERHTPFTFGRGEDNNIVVPSTTASRSHARITSHYGEFVFVDHSTNGSYVITAPGRHAYDGIDMHLHHRRWAMMGNGRISFGKPVAKNDSFLVHFMIKSVH